MHKLTCGIAITALLVTAGEAKKYVTTSSMILDARRQRPGPTITSTGSRRHCRHYAKVSSAGITRRLGSLGVSCAAAANCNVRSNGNVDGTAPLAGSVSLSPSSISRTNCFPVTRRPPPMCSGALRPANCSTTTRSIVSGNVRPWKRASLMCR